MNIENKSNNFLWAKEKSLDFFIKQIQEYFPNDPSTVTEDELVVGMSIEACNHEEFGLLLGFQTQKNQNDDEANEFLKLFNWDYPKDKFEMAEITEFANNDPQMIELFGSIIYHMFDGSEPLPTGRYTNFEESGFVLENGVLPENELPDDWFEFAMEVAVYMAEKFAENPELTACIPKAKDFFVVPCRNLGSACEVIPPEFATLSVKNKEILEQLIAVNNI